MAQQKYLIDTSSFIAHKKTHIILNDALPKSYRISAVVLQELIAGASDVNIIKGYEAIRKNLEKEKRLITPDSEDWLIAGKIFYTLINKERSKYGRAKGKSKEEINRIIRDSLIARTAERENCVVVTENIKDFKLIKPYCNIKIIKGSDFFG
jgi:predicted nucleic acid-binding protein